VSKYVIPLAFFTAVFGNTAQLASNANTNRISATPALGKPWHFITKFANRL
jgi:hypothetical protein